ATLVAVELARARDRIERVARGRALVEREAEVVVGRRVVRGPARVAFGGAVLEDHAAKGGLCAEATVRPDRQHAFAAAVGPAEAGVHLQRAGAVADAAQRGGLGEAEGAEERAVGALDPDRDLGARGRREADLDDSVLCVSRARERAQEK